MNNEAKNLANNLKLLMNYYEHTQAILEAKSGLAQKTISNAINPNDNKSPTLRTIELIAKVYNLRAWNLLYPNATIDILINPSFEKVVNNYVNVGNDERQAWANIAEITAKKYSNQ
jgi:transcriptional regulator with XRE-family HTH domain